jgi:hypothetical protein
VMRFIGKRDLTVVEMSKANNAMYLFSTETFEQKVGSIADARFSFRALKDTVNSLARRAHREPWQQRFSQELADFGILPGAVRR